MSVSSLSFWQQDQNWNIAQQGWSAQLSGTNLASSAMAAALSKQSSGQASIYNQEALTRVNKQIATLASSALNSLKSGSTANSPTVSVSTSQSSGMLTSYAPALQSAGTAVSMLSSVTSASFATGGLVSILT